MSGILDAKERIFDTIITKEGRAQIAKGELRVRFASFTDGSTYYAADAVSGSENLDNRIILEASSKKQDQITFETDDSGQLVPFISDSLVLRDGRIISSSNSIPSGERFASLAGRLIASTTENYRDQLPIGTNNPFDDEESFDTNILTGTFSITNHRPIPQDSKSTVASVDSIPSFFQDPHLSHIPNFRHLPPVIHETGDSLGKFPCVGSNRPMSYEEVARKVSEKECKQILFFNSSRSNNLVTQIFESSQSGLKKLDIIDFGEFLTSDEERPRKQVYFVGKVFEDSQGTNVFVNMLTIIFD